MLDLSHHAVSITYLILWAAVFARQICLPVPANLFLLTAGALACGGGLDMRLVLCRNPRVSRWRPCLVRSRPTLGQSDHADTLCF
jgi:hypothetical protein